MSKSSIFDDNEALKNPNQGGVGFNLVSQVNSFHAVFDTKPLDAKEANEIERLLVDNFQPGQADEEQVEKDVEQLKLITSEIKAIGKQGTILMGERVHKARELLKTYKDGTFTKWLESTFGTRKTGYNMLAYYDLYTALPHDDLRESLKKLPQRTAYILASRHGDIDTKAEIINEYHDRTHDELVILIQEKLPVALGDKRKAKSSNERLISAMKEAAQKLQKRKTALTEDDRNGLATLAQMIGALINV